MRALAEFIMRGRLQASLVALLGNLVPMISPAAIGLVTLRRSVQDGVLVLLWAAIPLLATLVLGADSYLVVLTSLTALVVVVVGAEVLKATVSWQVTLLAILAACTVLIMASGALMPEEAQRVTAAVQTQVGQLDGGALDAVSPFVMLMAITAAGLGVEDVTPGFVLGFLCWLTSVHVTFSLLLSRWWQALLYNPGGFRTEFHSLRFSPLPALLLIVAVLAVQFLPPGWMPWASMMGFPLLLAAVGLVHHTVSALGLGSGWLFLFYGGLILLSPLSMVLIGIGFLDSVLDFRARIAGLRKKP